jgi:hypothetical protein
VAGLARSGPAPPVAKARRSASSRENARETFAVSPRTISLTILFSKKLDLHIPPL